MGSFLRPAALMKMREAYAAGNAGAEELRATEDAAIRDLVAKEKEVGLRAVTDGEFRRRYWHLDFLAALGGVEELGAAHWSVAFKGAQLKAATVKVEILFGGCHVDGFFLEYDSDRAGGFAPLDYIKDQRVVLGLVTSKSGTLEKKEDIVARIHEAAKHVPLDQLCLSPQCGFSSTEEGNLLTEEEQWNKLRFIKEIAESVWK